MKMNTSENKLDTVYEVYPWKKIEDQLQKDLSASRYRHTLGVSYTAAAMAMRYGADIDQARVAGLLHDCAKGFSTAKMLELIRQHEIPVTAFEKEHPALLHAKIGPYIAQKRYGITDPKVLSAITWHTTGKPNMELLEKIIYIADYIEPNRDKMENLPAVRALAFKDLELCLYQILKDSILYLSGRPQEMDEMTKKAYAYYRDLHSARSLEHEKHEN